MTRLFLDCEWADLEGTRLVSLALVSQDAQHHFYAEIDPLPEQPTDFVRDTVYPLLERGDTARSSQALSEGIRAFLAGFERPVVLYDYHVDGKLLERALQPVGGTGVIPDLQLSLIFNDRVMRLVEEYFALNPAEADRRHHALVDARALRWAFVLALKYRKRGDRMAL
jgi:hypothetical protein